ncbi:MAG TPA: hypothetical protein VHY35_01665 [Stellaceae bacterium]|jgi:hypothetical protein|nr:hypothetical protein [Stellaceae bacterium]
MANSTNGTISQRISLVGGDDVVKQLQQLGDAGEKAVKQVQAATATPAGPLTDVSAVLTKLSPQLIGFGDQGTKALRQLQDASNASSGGFTALLFGISRLVPSFRGATEILKPMAEGFTELKGKVSEFGTALSEVATKIIPNFERVAALAAGASVGLLVEQISKANEELVAEANSAKLLNLTAEQFDALKQAAASSGISIDQAKEAYARFQGAIGAAAESQKGFNASLTSAVQVLRGNADATAAAAGNSDILRGGAKALADQMSGTVNVLRGSNAAAADNSNTFKRLGVDIFDVGGKLRAPTDILGDMLDKLSKLRDPAIQAREQAQLFSRDWTATVPALKNFADALGVAKTAADNLNKVPLPKVTITQPAGGGLAIENPNIKMVTENPNISMPTLKPNQAVAPSLGPPVRVVPPAATKEDGIPFTQLARQFASAKAELDRGLEDLRNHIGAVLGVALVPAFTALTQAINANGQSIIEWAQGIGEKAKPIITDFVTLIQNLGRADDQQQPLKTDFVKGLITAFEGAKDVVLALRTAFTGLSAAIDVVLGPINDIFGTKLTSGVVLITGLILQFTGAFGLLGSALGVIDALISSFVTGPLVLIAEGLGSIVALIGWPALLIAGITALVAYILTTTNAWSALKGWINDAWNVVKDFGSYLATGFKSILDAAGGWFQHVWALFDYWAEYYFGIVIQKLQALWDKIKAAGSAIASVFGAGGGTGDIAQPPISGAGGAINSGAATQSLATGGLIRGPGGPRDDRVPIWSSNGEFVLRTAAVRQVGLDFLYHLNRTGNVFTSLRQGMRGYSVGGLVAGFADRLTDGFMPRPLLNFAGGGLLLGDGGGSAGRVAVTLNIGGQTFADMLTPKDVATKLVKYARQSSITSGGRKPSWYGGGR